MKDLTRESRLSGLDFMVNSSLVSFSNLRKGLSPWSAECAIVLLYLTSFLFIPSFCVRLVVDSLLVLSLLNLCLTEKSKSSRLSSCLPSVISSITIFGYANDSVRSTSPCDAARDIFRHPLSDIYDLILFVSDIFLMVTCLFGCREVVLANSSMLRLNPTILSHFSWVNASRTCVISFSSFLASTNSACIYLTLFLVIRHFGLYSTVPSFL